MVMVMTSDVFTPGDVLVNIPGDPVPWARAGRGFGRTFTPKRQEAWGTKAAACMRISMRARPPLEGPLSLYVVVVWARPKAMNRLADRGRAWRTARPDFDNAVKGLCDRANGILWQDDAQVVDARVLKVIAAAGEEAHVELVVTSLEGS